VVKTDASGNVYVTGYFSGTVDFDPSVATFNLTSAGSTDIYIAKYSSAGALLWAEQMGGSGADEGTAITFDGSGNFMLAARFNGTVDFDPGAGVANFTSNGNSDMFFGKYDSNGNFLWGKSIGTPDDQDFIRDIKFTTAATFLSADILAPARWMPIPEPVWPTW